MPKHRQFEVIPLIKYPESSPGTREEANLFVLRKFVNPKLLNSQNADLRFWASAGLNPALKRSLSHANVLFSNTFVLSGQVARDNVRFSNTGLEWPRTNEDC
jgi:hypothetical protein